MQVKFLTQEQDGSAAYAEVLEVLLQLRAIEGN